MGRRTVNERGKRLVIGAGKVNQRVPVIDLLSVWHAVVAADQLSFHRAATVIGVRQSAVSRRVRALEDELGVSLFERKVSGVYPTTAGLEFLHHARSILSDVDYAVKVSRAAGRGATGHLRVGFFASLACGFLRDLLSEFKRQHGNVDIDVWHGGPDDHIRQIRDHSMDIAFCTGSPELSDCDVELLWSERVYCVLPATHRLAKRASVDWADLRDESFIVSRDEPGPEIHEYLIRRLATLGFHPSVRRLAVCRESLIHLVAMDFGVTLTSESTISTPFRGIVFRPFKSARDVLPCVGIWSPENDNPALRRLISLARSLKSTHTWATGCYRDHTFQ